VSDHRTPPSRAGARAVIAGWLAAFVVIFASNGLFHTFVAAALYDPPLLGIMRPMARADPFRVALVDVVLAGAMAYFILRPAARPARPARPRDAAAAGAVVGLVGAWTYNVVNSALIPRWPATAAIVDVLWHVALGAIGGVLLARVHRALARPQGPAT
jgi:uncharacterized membrane protein